MHCTTMERLLEPVGSESAYGDFYEQSSNLENPRNNTASLTRRIIVSCSLESYGPAWMGIF
jgi:hypothetical protein